MVNHPDSGGFSEFDRVFPEYTAQAESYHTISPGNSGFVTQRQYSTFFRYWSLV